MKVVVFPADDGGCGHYRLIMAAMHLRSEGHDVTIQWPRSATSNFALLIDDDTGEVLDFKLPGDDGNDVDVVVMQRVSHELHSKSLALMREKGIATVIDMDDNLGVIHPRNSAFWNYRTRSLTPFSSKVAEQICREATLVTTSTRNLYNVYAKHGRGAIIDNYVPERYLAINVPQEEEPVFGWGGTLKSHPTDLMVMGKAVREMVDQGHRFRIIGLGEPAISQQLGLAERAEATGATDLFGWPTALAQLDVGLAPLEAGSFNTAKSRLKLLEYASLGIPYVASPREEYRRYHRESGGAGLLVDTPKQWAAGIKELMTNETRRKELAEQAKQFAATQTIELNSWRWLEAWQRAYDIQRGKR